MGRPVGSRTCHSFTDKAKLIEYINNNKDSKKDCTRCKDSKPLTEYYKSPINGRWYLCARCTGCVTKQNGARHKERALERKGLKEPKPKKVPTGALPKASKNSKRPAKVTSTIKDKLSTHKSSFASSSSSSSKSKNGFSAQTSLPTQKLKKEVPLREIMESTDPVKRQIEIANSVVQQVKANPPPRVSAPAPSRPHAPPKVSTPAPTKASTPTPPKTSTPTPSSSQSTKPAKVEKTPAKQITIDKPLKRPRGESSFDVQDTRPTKTRRIDKTEFHNENVTSTPTKRVRGSSSIDVQDNRPTKTRRTDKTEFHNENVTARPTKRGIGTPSFAAQDNRPKKARRADNKEFYNETVTSKAVKRARGTSSFDVQDTRPTKTRRIDKTAFHNENVTSKAVKRAKEDNLKSTSDNRPTKKARVVVKVAKKKAKK